MNRQRNNSSMEVNGLFAIINTPEALKGEGVHGLPPHAPVNAYVVDEYPNCPETWMHGSAKASSYFCPVDAGKGMWFDFTANQNHKHHIAVVVSVQGINPVDGRVHRYFTDGNVLMRLRDGGTKKFLIEIKPAKQLQPPNPNAKRKTLVYEQLRYAINQSKFKTAEQWANKHGYTFLILTEKELNIE